MFVKNVKNCENCQELWKLSRIVKNCQDLCKCENCENYLRGGQHCPRGGQQCPRDYSLVAELLELIHGFSTAVPPPPLVFWDESETNLFSLLQKSIALIYGNSHIFSFISSLLFKTWTRSIFRQLETLTPHVKWNNSNCLGYSAFETFRWPLQVY